MFSKTDDLLQEKPRKKDLMEGCCKNRSLNKAVDTVNGKENANPNSNV